MMVLKREKWDDIVRRNFGALLQFQQKENDVEGSVNCEEKKPRKVSLK